MRSIARRIHAFNAGRDPARLERKYDAMRSDPFVFFRGTSHLFWEDWAHDAGDLDDAPLTWACGDLHLENFGCFRGDNRLVYFDLNDFDDAALAPATADTTRLLTSTHLAATSLGFGESEARQLIAYFLDAYCQALSDGKARWVERDTATGMVRDLLRQVQGRRRRELLASRTEIVHGERRIRIDGKRAVELSADERARVIEGVHQFAHSRRAARGNRRTRIVGITRLEPHADDPFHVIDVAGRIAGTGSLGLRRYAVLIEGHGGANGQFLLDIKQATDCPVVTHLKVSQPAWRTPAERVVSVQHNMQAISPALLSPLHFDGADFILRELQPTEDRLALADWNGKLSRLEKVLATMGHIAAWDQLRSASRDGSAGIDELVVFGRARTWRRRAVEYAHHYATVATRDWREFCRD